jgi:cell division protein FtsZ
MIQLSKNYSLPAREEETIPIKVVGVGGAGSNALDRVVLDGMEKADLIAINTDVQALASSVAAHKVQLGRSTTRGLGTGGDPEVGYQAACESADEIRNALTDARMIFVCAGLGGGTGSGAAPFVANLARESGALVIVFATMPFSFEGKRRSAQAQEALVRLNQVANAVICFENDSMGDMVAPNAGIHQAFAMADLTVSQSVRSIVGLIQRPGLIRIGFDDLFTALRSQNGRCLFGFGESGSDNRAHDALTQALKNPLMGKGKLLADAEHVLVQVAGGPAMTLSEVEILMRELGRHVRDHTQIIFGTAVDSRMGDRLSVTIISSLGVAMDVPSPQETFAAPEEPALPPAVPIWEEPQMQAEPQPEVSRDPVEESPPPPPLISEMIEPAPIAMPADQLMPVDAPEPIGQPLPETSETKKPAGPRIIPPKKRPLPMVAPAAVVPAKPKREMAQARQEVLQFEPVTRGRFEKSEPTIVEGEDLDVPTFLRKNVRVK